MQGNNLNSPDKEKVETVEIISCRCGYTFTFFSTSDNEKPDGLKGIGEFSDVCGCDCDYCRLRQKRYIPASKYFKKDLSTNMDIGKPSSQGKNLPKDQQRDYSPFLQKELKKISDVKEYEKNHPNMEYAAGESVRDMMGEEAWQDWKRRKKRRKQQKEESDGS